MELARALVNALEDKKAEEIVLLDVSAESSFAEYFIICTGGSERQLKALADTVHEAVHITHQLKSPRVEGKGENGWVLVDCPGVVVHLFSPTQRQRYQLEELWQTSKRLLHIQ